MNCPSSSLPVIFFSYETVLICLRKFQRISGEIDETVTHVSLWKFLKFLNNSTETCMPLNFFPKLEGARAPMPHS